MNFRSPSVKYILALIIASVVAELLFSFNVISNHDLSFDYLSWNLLLAWIPLILAIRLTAVLRHKRWSSWEGLLLTSLWLLFLPNSFYMISDYIHLTTVSLNNAVYDALILTSFIYIGVILGFSSLFLIHLHLTRRLSTRESSVWVAVILFICSAGVYFGRDLRWSSWDVLINPGGLLFDISDRLYHISEYPNMVVTILSLFILLLSMYNLIWRGAHLFQLKRPKP